MIDEYAAMHPYFINRDHPFSIATRFTYGAPGKDDIAQEAAIELGKQQIIALGASAQTVDRRDVDCFFDMTDPDKPKWKLVFYRVSGLDPQKTNYKDTAISCYRVVIDARTAEVLEAFEITLQMDKLEYRL